MPIDESAMAGQKIGTFARYAAVRMPSLVGLLPQMLAQLVEKLARRVRPPLELEHEGGDPLVVAAELVLARQRVVDPIDALGRERRVIERGRADEMPAPARFMQVVIEVRAGRHEAVDVAVLDEVRDDQAHAAGREGARGAQENRRVAAEHLLPDAPRGREVAPLKRNALHARQDVVGGQAGRDDERLDRLAQEAGFSLMAFAFYRTARDTSFRNAKSAIGESVTPSRSGCAIATLVLYQRLM